MKRLILCIIALVIIAVFTPMVSADYTLQVQALTNSPADGATVYLGVAPSAPASTVNLSTQIIPRGGWLNTTEIYDYSGTAGTNQAYSYYIRVNNTQDYLVSTLSVATSERVFSNTSMGIQVFKGDYFEVKRIQPTWATNPLTNIVGGYVLIDTPDEVDRGYPVYGMALSNSPADGATNYLGSKPSVPETVEGRSKIFIPTEGLITQAHINDYSNTAGTAEAYSYSLDVNSTDYLVETESVSAANRFFDNISMSIPVQVGNYAELKRLHPTWVTNPLANVVGGTIWINTTDIHNIDDGYPIHTFALTHTPGDAQTTYFGDRPIAPSTSAGTNKIYIRQNGWIKKAGVYSYSGTAGSAEPWAMYVRVNNANDYLIQSKSLNTNERMWVNVSMDIPVVSGDYVEIKSVTSTMATNPATTIYGGGFYMEYEDELPLSIFETNATIGTTPLAVQFTESTTLDPTGWEWYWTCIENSTAFKFSNAQNPENAFDAGHFQIGLNVTNASGYRYNSSSVIISSSASGGYNGFTQQDIYLTGQYTITFLVKSSTTNLPIANVTVVDAVSGQSYHTTDGTAYLTEPAGLIYVNFIADGYQSRQITYAIDEDATKTVKLTPSAPSPGNSPVPVYIPQQVRIRLVDFEGDYLSGVMVTATPVNFTAPANWTEILFGISPGVNITGSSVTGITGTDGSWVAPMLQSIQYNVSFTRDPDISYIVTLYPQQSEYVYTIPLGIMPITTPSNIITYSLSNATIDATHQYVNMTYTDSSGGTDYLQFAVFDTNNTMIHSANYTGTAANSQVYSQVVTCPKGTGTSYVINANQSQYGWINQSATIRLDTQVDLMLNGGPEWVKQWVAIGLIIIIGTLFSIFTRKYAGIAIGTAIFAFQYIFFWLPANWVSNIALLSIFGVGALIYIRESENKIQ